jgi:hypothetical protein
MAASEQTALPIIIELPLEANGQRP